LQDHFKSSLAEKAAGERCKTGEYRFNEFSQADYVPVACVRAWVCVCVSHKDDTVHVNKAIKSADARKINPS